MAVKYFITILSLIAFATGQITFPGLCNNASTVGDFDVQQYLGRWYELKRYDAIFEDEGECVTADYSLLTNGSVEVKNSLINKNQQYEEILGNAYEEDPAKHDGKLMVIFPGVGVRAAPYWVLGTDYKNYSVVWSCVQFNASLNFQFAWILSRSTTVTPEVEATITEILESNKIDQSQFRMTIQDSKTCANKPNHGTRVRLNLYLGLVVIYVNILRLKIF